MSTKAPILSIENHFKGYISYREQAFISYFEQWQVGEPQWKNRLGDGWVITKTLGAGAGGAASLWEYRGDPAKAPKLKQVVVKLVYDGYENYSDTYKGLRGEGAFLDLMRKVHTKHIIHMYGPPKIDHAGHVMYFLEYCPGGALSSVLQKHEEEVEKNKFPVSEREICSIFYCLARAVSAMDRGTEDLKQKRWDRDEIGHYDMIASNILIGYNDKIHQNCPVIGDFGDAMEIRRLELQTDETGKEDVQYRGATKCRPPEQRNMNVQHLRHGTCSNIYMVGIIMASLITSQPDALSNMFENDVLIVKGYNGKLQKGETVAGFLHKDENIRNAYSQPLRALVMECVMKEPLLRPGVVELQERTKKLFESSANIPGQDSNYSFGRDNVLLEDPEPPREWMGPNNDVGAGDYDDGKTARVSDNDDDNTSDIDVAPSAPIAKRKLKRPIHLYRYKKQPVKERAYRI
ncbi:hypothetical protein EYC80_005432 [Monilinia laxa]|uniref:Protein kinase domain-containing protein n=1 Tax=Monilinia laxa TaxID=61186 RepID=A0A5N6KJY9_MONLA|nr:hypothetical protein EYC80_005432 [Monilinia laxa]